MDWNIVNKNASHLIFVAGMIYLFYMYFDAARDYRNNKAELEEEESDKLKRIRDYSLIFAIALAVVYVFFFYRNFILEWLS